MPYVERVTKAGNTIEIERYFTSRYKKKGISRGDKVKPTKEEQEKVNTRQAERKLRILINANYGYGDYHLVLDYIRRKGEPDRTPEQMRQDIDVFLRECRKEYRKAGLEFKYIHVMEIGKKGARHHHLVVNKIDTEILQRCWYKAYEGHNRVKVFPLDDSGNYAELASYLIKYTGTHKKGTDGALQGNTYSAAVLDEFSAYKQSMEKYLTEIAGVYDSYVSKTEGLFAQYESQFNERYSSFESTLDNWDKELLSAYTEFMAKIKLFQSDAENEFNTWFESIKDKLGEDIAGSLQLQIEELAAAMQEVKKQAEAGTKETKEAIAALDERLKRVESGWGIDYKHDAVLGLCYMGAAYMSQHYERTVETAVLGATYVGNSYLANTF